MEQTTNDLEYIEERPELKQKTPIKKHIPLKLKSSSNLNAQTAQNENTSNQQQSSSLSSTTQNQTKTNVNSNLSHNLDSPIKRNHPISNLNWNMNVNAISEKITGQTMDYCMICCLPILIYGRLLPCKHVICIQCANSIQFQSCLKDSCNEKIDRIEQAVKGGIFICDYDLDFNNSSSNIEKFRANPDMSQKKLCGRSYMSQRDLTAHIKHRHDQ